MPWIEGKRVVVTGATSGIGMEVATALAAAGADVVLACRDRARAEAVASDIATNTSGRAPQVLSIDTSDAGSIRTFAQRYAKRYERLDVLVNNVGVLLPERTVSAAGVELTFATNVLGYYLVATELCNALPAPPSRIVNVASAFAFALDLDDLQFQRPALRRDGCLRAVEGVRPAAHVGAGSSTGAAGGGRQRRRPGDSSSRRRCIERSHPMHGESSSSTGRGRWTTEPTPPSGSRAAMKRSA